MAPKAISTSQTHCSASYSSFSERQKRSIDLIAHRTGAKERKASAQYSHDQEAPGSLSEDADDEKEKDSRAEKMACKRRLQKQRKEREKRRQKEERKKEKKHKRWEKTLEKNDEIMEWRDTFEVGEKPKGIEKQFPVRSVIPSPREHRWLVPARTSRTMLECA